MNQLLGYIELKSGKMLVTDPCYIPESLGGDGTPVVDTPTGKFPVFVDIVDEGTWGLRTSALRIEFKNGGFGSERDLGVAYVDSGQMSFTDFANVEEWGGDERDGGWDTEAHRGQFDYQGVCDLTYRDDEPQRKGGVIDTLMAASQTGYGDGAYPVVGIYLGDTLTAVTVKFIEEEDE